MTHLRRTGAQAVIDSMEKHGVEYIFGYPGGNNMPLFDALLESSIKLVLCRHEQGATHMADGYARATGKAGVVLVTSGPGATNTVTGIMTAYMDSVPMVVVCGQTITPNLGLDAFQEADVSGISFPVVKHSYLVKDPAEIPRIMKEAFHLAETGRPGPVLIDLPKDVSSALFEPDYSVEINIPGYVIPAEGDPDEIAAAAEALSRAKRPLLLVGHGAVISGAEKAVKALVEKLQVPVTTTLLGKGAFPEHHPFALGMLGMHGTAYANKAVEACDLIVSIGSRWDDRIIGDPKVFCRDAVKIHIDIDLAERDKSIPVDHFIHGDARLVLEALVPLVRRGDTAGWIAQIAAWKKKHPLRYRKQGGLRAQYVLDELDRLTGSQAIVATDVGQHQMWAAQFMRTQYRYQWISSGGAGTMGFGFPAALGAALGRPDRTVVAVVGDGGFQMTEMELATAKLQKLPVKIVILDNKYLGMVRQWQDLFFDDRYSGVDMEGNPDFVKLAEAYGIKAFRVRRKGDVRRVLEAALAYTDGPCLIHAEVEKEENVFPMIPAGLSYDHMILEEPASTVKLAKPVGGT